MGRFFVDVIVGFVAFAGIVCGTICVSFIGLLSIFAPETAEKILQELQEWSGGE